MKVHVTIRESALSNAEAALGKIVAAGMRDVNRSRFEAFGVISGDIDENQLEALRGLDVVETVEADEKKSVREGGR